MKWLVVHLMIHKHQHCAGMLGNVAQVCDDLGQAISSISTLVHPDREMVERLQMK